MKKEPPVQQQSRVVRARRAAATWLVVSVIGWAGVAAASHADSPLEAALARAGASVSQIIAVRPQAAAAIGIGHCNGD